MRVRAGTSVNPTSAVLTVITSIGITRSSIHAQGIGIRLALSNAPGSNKVHHAERGNPSQRQATGHEREEGNAWRLFCAFGGAASQHRPVPGLVGARSHSTPGNRAYSDRQTR